MVKVGWGLWGCSPTTSTSWESSPSPGPWVWAPCWGRRGTEHPGVPPSSRGGWDLQALEAFLSCCGSLTFTTTQVSAMCVPLRRQLALNPGSDSLRFSPATTAPPWGASGAALGLLKLLLVSTAQTPDQAQEHQPPRQG